MPTEIAEAPSEEVMATPSQLEASLLLSDDTIKDFVHNRRGELEFRCDDGEAIYEHIIKAAKLLSILDPYQGKPDNSSTFQLDHKNWDRIFYDEYIEPSFSEFCRIFSIHSGWTIRNFHTVSGINPFIISVRPSLYLDIILVHPAKFYNLFPHIDLIPCELGGLSVISNTCLYINLGAATREDDLAEDLLYLVNNLIRLSLQKRREVLYSENDPSKLSNNKGMLAYMSFRSKDLDRKKIDTTRIFNNQQDMCNKTKDAYESALHKLEAVRTEMELLSSDFLTPFQNEIKNDFCELLKLNGSQYFSKIEILSSPFLTVRAHCRDIKVAHKGIEFLMGNPIIILEETATRGLKIRIDNETKKIEGYPHPHVSKDLQPCWGTDFSSIINELLASGNIHSTLLATYEFLNNYNTKNPYISIEKWWDKKHIIPYGTGITPQSTDWFDRCVITASPKRDCIDCKYTNCQHKPSAFNRCYTVISANTCLSCTYTTCDYNKNELLKVQSYTPEVVTEKDLTPEIMAKFYSARASQSKDTVNIVYLLATISELVIGLKGFVEELVTAFESLEKASFLSINTTTNKASYKDAELDVSEALLSTWVMYSKNIIKFKKQLNSIYPNFEFPYPESYSLEKAFGDVIALLRFMEHTKLFTISITSEKDDDMTIRKLDDTIKNKTFSFAMKCLFGTEKNHINVMLSDMKGSLSFLGILAKIKCIDTNRNTSCDTYFTDNDSGCTGFYYNSELIKTFLGDKNALLSKLLKDAKFCYTTRLSGQENEAKLGGVVTSEYGQLTSQLYNVLKAVIISRGAFPTSIVSILDINSIVTLQLLVWVSPNAKHAEADVYKDAMKFVMFINILATITFYSFEISAQSNDNASRSRLYSILASYRESGFINRIIEEKVFCSDDDTKVKFILSFLETVYQAIFGFSIYTVKACPSPTTYLSALGKLDVEEMRQYCRNSIFAYSNMDKVNLLEDIVLRRIEIPSDIKDHATLSPFPDVFISPIQRLLDNTTRMSARTNQIVSGLKAEFERRRLDAIKLDKNTNRQSIDAPFIPMVDALYSRLHPSATPPSNGGNTSTEVSEDGDGDKEGEPSLRTITTSSGEKIQNMSFIRLSPANDDLSEFSNFFKPPFHDFGRSLEKISIIFGIYPTTYFATPYANPRSLHPIDCSASSEKNAHIAILLLYIRQFDGAVYKPLYTSSIRNIVYGFIRHFVTFEGNQPWDANFPVFNIEKFKANTEVATEIEWFLKSYVGMSGMLPVDFLILINEISEELKNSVMECKNRIDSMPDAFVHFWNVNFSSPRSLEHGMNNLYEAHLPKLSKEPRKAC